MSADSPFAIKAYKKLFAAQIISLAGTGITTVALALLAWDLAGDQAGRVLGTALALKMAAYVVLAPLISSAAQKLPRRKWLLGLDLARAPLVLYLPFVTEVWEIYLILFLINACSAGFTPVFQATIADIVKQETPYLKALSYSRLAYDLEQLLSPSAAALLLTLMSFNYLFVLDAFSFLLSAIIIFFTVIPAAPASSHFNNYLYNLRFGLSAYLKTPRLRALLAMYVAVACASAVMITGTVVYVSDYFGKGESSTALALAVSGGGSMIVALLLPRWLKHLEVRHALFTGAVILVCGLFFAATGPGWISFLTTWFALGVGLSFIQVPAGSLVRMSCHPDDAVALFAANFSLSHLCWLFAYPLSGIIGAEYGMQTAFAVMGGIALAAGFASWRYYPTPDKIEIEHTHKTQAHKHLNGHDSSHDLVEEPVDQSLNGLHTHEQITHKHKFVIDMHHPRWP